MQKQAGIKLTKEKVVERFREKHGNKYSYSRFSYYENSSQKISIICPKHGEFIQTCQAHWIGRGCPSCAHSGILLDEKEILDRFKKAHGDTYDYSQVVFKNVNTKVKILCKTHGTFEQTPKSHYHLKTGCPNCAKNHRETNDGWLFRFKKVHGNRYSYENSKITNSKTKIQIDCLVHGSFYQSPEVHSKGHGCKKCASEKQAQDNTTIDFETFRYRANKVHNSRYTYLPENYNGYTKRGIIICPLHGPFEQPFSNHVINKIGCPSCSCIRSKAEGELADWIKGLGVRVDRGKRSIIPPFELDIYLPDLNMAIEYCGLRWHGQFFGKKDKKYHLRKLNMCEEKGIELVTVFEDEFLHKRHIVETVLRKKLGKAKKGVPARKTTVKEICWLDCKEFLDNHHLQGSGSPVKIRYGAFDGPNLVGVMTFSTGRVALCSNKQPVYELVRYASDEFIHSGLASKLFKAFVREHSPKKIVSYADRRWFAGTIYNTMGFVRQTVTPPSYWYFKNPDNVRYHRYNFRKGVVVNKMGGDSKLTEWENMKTFGYDRIWDCGTIKFEWVNIDNTGD